MTSTRWRTTTPAPSGTTRKAAAEIENAPAHDVVLGRVEEHNLWSPMGSAAKLDWLYEWEQVIAWQRRSEKDGPAEKVVDKLLATSWP